MKNYKFQKTFALVLATVAIIVRNSAFAATVWTGPNVTFAKAPGDDPTDPANQDRLTGRVSLTRSDSQGIFNATTESGFAHTFSPADTEWANGSLANFATLVYTDWNTWAKVKNPGPPSTVGVQAVVHLKTDDIYLAVKFTAWSAGGSGGGFAYVRSSPAAVAATPTVMLTSPAEGTVFSDPANIKLIADATVAGGTVTNVSFILNTEPVGSDLTSPFEATVPGVVAGAYSLTAVATAGGVSATSGVVHVTVVSPVNITLSPPTVGGGSISFNYSANAGLRYAIEKAAAIDLSGAFDWTPVITNTAASNLPLYSESFTAGATQFYRVRRMPNR